MIVGTAETRTENRASSFRWKAFAIHLGVSLVVLGALLYALFFYWFPGYLFDTDGGWQALRVIAGVDIILGPMLTLIAANPKKSSGELRKDFTIIGLIQVCALSAGTWLAWDNRPYAMLWYDGMVYSLPWSALQGEDDALAAIHRLAPDTPRWVVVDLPFDLDARARAIDAARDIGKDPLFDSRLYRPWPPAPATLAAFTTLAVDLASGKDADSLRNAIENLRRQQPDGQLMAVRSRYDTYFIAVAGNSGERLEAIRLAPGEQILTGAYPRWRLKDLLSAGSATATQKTQLPGPP